MTDTPPLPSQPNLYVLDANVFIAAWRDNFRPQLFPDLWERILDLCREGTLVSIDRVLAEITSPPDLVAWLQSNEDDIFASSIEPSVSLEVSAMQTWAQSADQYSRAARDEFARVADCWLAAYAKSRGATVVTNEVFNATVKRRIPLANVCERFDIDYLNTADFFQRLGLEFRLGSP